MKRERGFTLIELMIALVVMAILTAIAYPSYTNQVLKSRRADGIAALNRAAMEMESCRSDNDGSYLNCETFAVSTAVPQRTASMSSPPPLLQRQPPIRSMPMLRASSWPRTSSAQS